MSYLTGYNPPADTSKMTALEKRDLAKLDFKTAKDITGLLFNIQYHVRTIYCVLEELRSFAHLQSLRQMMSEA